MIDGRMALGFHRLIAPMDFIGNTIAVAFIVFIAFVVFFGFMSIVDFMTFIGKTFRIALQAMSMTCLGERHNALHSISKSNQLLFRITFIVFIAFVAFFAFIVFIAMAFIGNTIVLAFIDDRRTIGLACIAFMTPMDFIGNTIVFASIDDRRTIGLACIAFMAPMAFIGMAIVEYALTDQRP